jgi:CTP synthase
VLHEEGLDAYLVRHLRLEDRAAATPDLSDWRSLVERIHNPRRVVKIALVGKYINLPDAYLSVTQALAHAGFHHGVDVEVHWVASDQLEDDKAKEVLDGMDGILIPGGFGVRGVEGKVEAIRYAREQKVPFFGICLGLQCAVIEFARNVAGLAGANSSEFDQDSPYPVIDLMPDQRGLSDMGGTMRLGLDPCRMTRGSKAEEAYGDHLVFERHRHRYEVNNRFRRRLEEAGLIFSGTSPDQRLVEIIELGDHPWFVAGQFHPEFRSRPTRPHPLFRDFVGAATELADRREEQPNRAGEGKGPSGRRQQRDGRVQEPTPPRPAARIGVQDLVGEHERMAESFQPRTRRSGQPPSEGFTPAVVSSDDRDPVIRLPGTERAGRPAGNGHAPYDLDDSDLGPGGRQGEAGSL